MEMKVIKELLGEAENKDAIIAEINKQNGIDVEKQKSKLAEVETENASLKSKVTELSNSESDSTAIKLELDNLKQSIETDRLAKEQQEAENARLNAISARFDTVIGTNKFRDELTSNGVKTMFMNALDDEANKGKGDAEIFESLTKDNNYFENPNKPGDMTKTGTVNNQIELSDFDRMNKLVYGE